MEIKLTLSPSISKGSRVAFRELQPERGFVVYPGPDSYRLSDKVWATPLTHLMRQLSSIKGLRSPQLKDWPRMAIKRKALYPHPFRSRLQFSPRMQDS